MHEVELTSRPLGTLTSLLPAGQAAKLGAAAARVREVLAGRVLWNVSATEAGGGVAEMLHTQLGYLIAAGVETRWLVLDGDDEFFAMTKCLHNAIHGLGDPAGFGAGVQQFTECLSKWEGLPAAVRKRISLVSIPMDDLDENATIVNAIQRQAMVIAQKSLAEGFGLTVAEAMWKAKPVVASAVGGIQDQITDGQDGMLVDDPADVDAFGVALCRLMTDRPFAHLLAEAAHQRVLENFLDDRHLVQFADLFGAMVTGRR